MRMDVYALYRARRRVGNFLSFPRQPRTHVSGTAEGVGGGTDGLSQRTNNAVAIHALLSLTTQCDVLDGSDGSLPEVAAISSTSRRKPRQKLGAKKAGREHVRRVVSGNKDEGRETGGFDSTEVVLMTWRRGDNDMAPNPKIIQLIKHPKERDSTADKMTCYSQWSSMLDIIEKTLSCHVIGSLGFDGKMDKSEQDATLATFKQHDGLKTFIGRCIDRVVFPSAQSAEALSPPTL
ncbi:hypothetical protein CVT26_002400 [Gymnopilus dilepis]|uniref:Uncharacterized protein n=1 Tax=Gymnopilus dilepis TaxID=231916 RepID=A0A409Y3T4_9AGAR|nr:hypothetical protein CVT26_002400 [Gymnopilus dilepis]